MAEFVQSRIEEMLPELEQMERVQLFTNKEIRSIIKKRKEYEYKIQRRTKSKEDYLHYIQYEINLLHLVWKRRERIGYQHKKEEIDYTIANRIIGLFSLGCQRFANDVQMWMSRIDFCKKMQMKAAVSRTYSRLLQLHNDKPNLWVSAAKWELEELKSVENARNLLLRGLRFHPKSHLLYHELFRLELMHVDQLRKRHIVLGVEEESNEDPVMSAALAATVYKQALDNCPTPQLILDLLSTARLFDFTEEIQVKLKRDLQEKFPENEVMWDSLARSKLEQPTAKRKIDETDAEKQPGKKVKLKERLQWCYDTFEEAVERVPSEAMWSYYVQACLDLLSSSDQLSNLKTRQLIAVMSRAAAHGKLQEKHYHCWIEILQGAGRLQDAVAALRNGVTAYPKSVALWRLRLQLAMRRGLPQREVTQMLGEAVVSVGDTHEALPLWQLVLEWLGNTEAALTLYERALHREPSIAKPLKNKYLEWVYSSKNLERAWDLYWQYCDQPPFSLDFHYTIIELESQGDSPQWHKIRSVYRKACEQFGRTESGLWLRWITFEQENGEPIQVSKLYQRAQKTLEAASWEEFSYHHTLSRIQ